MPHNSKHRHISAHYVIAGGEMLKRAVITVDNDGVIIGIDDVLLPESRAVEFYNGILIPGLFNCHCHLELSRLKGTVTEKIGLPTFLSNMRHRSLGYDNQAIVSADKEMYNNGVVFCVDTCNSSESFEIKKTSKLQYYNNIEIFGSLPVVTNDRMKYAEMLVRQSLDYGLDCFVSPHSAYSVSIPLLNAIRKASKDIVSIHFMESATEKQYLKDMTGLLATSFKEDGLLPLADSVPANHLQAIEESVKEDSHLILVHNTFVEQEIVQQLVKRKNVWWCICPNSNLYIENSLPPVEMLLSEGASLVMGTDSLASNHQLSILEEMKTIQRNFVNISLVDIVKWATINGAEAFNVVDSLGSIEIGKRPGIMLLENLDLQAKRLTEDTNIIRLV